MKYQFTLIVFTVLLLLSCTTSVDKTTVLNSNNLEGTWEMKEIHWVLKDTTYSILNAQPGVFILTPDSYATMWTPTREPRVPFTNLSQPTDEEKIAGFGSVVFNSGTYTKTDSTLTTTAIIAKVPGFEGGIQYYRYKVVGDNLELTMFDETYPDGNKPEWFGRVESKFIYTRMAP